MGENGGGGRTLSRLIAIGTAGGASGILIYALFETTYTRAYAQLGLEPEEVGVTTGNIIARSVGILLVPLPVLAIAAVLVLIAVIAILGILLLFGLWSAGGFWKRTFALVFAFLAVWAIQAIINNGNVGAAARMGVYGRMWDLPDAYVSGIKQGIPTEPTKVDGLIIFYMRADVARVNPSGGNTEAGSQVRSVMNKTVLYLGAANGISVFYDASTQTAIKIPSSTIVVSIQDANGRVDPACSLKPVPRIFGLSVFHFEGRLSC